MNATADAERPRVGFVSAVEIGAACIDEIYQIGGRLNVIMTLDAAVDRRKSGRVSLAGLADKHQCELAQIRNINDPDAMEGLKRADLDWLFIVGWSQIASLEVLSIPSIGSIGAHPTLLPQGRGRAPIPWTILKGLGASGVTFFQIDEGVDTGPIIDQDRFPIARGETAASLYRKVVAAHRRVVRRVWSQLERGAVVSHPQNEAGATVWPKRTPLDGEITTKMTVDEIDRLVRATTRPYPGAFVPSDDSVVRVWGGTVQRSALATKAHRIQATDGVYWATDFDIEKAEPT